jgi:hypothetical protein
MKSSQASVHLENGRIEWGYDMVSMVWVKLHSTDYLFSLNCGSSVSRMDFLMSCAQFSNWNSNHMAIMSNVLLKNLSLGALLVDNRATKQW